MYIQKFIKHTFPVLLFFMSIMCISLYANNADDAKARMEIIKKQTDSVMRTLSLHEKVAQLFIIQFSAGQSEKAKKIQDRLIRKKIGGLIIMDGKLIPTIERLNELHKHAKIPLMVSIDGEWGSGMRFDETYSYPRQMQLGALNSDTLIYKMGRAIGEEFRLLGIHINYAPDVDINNNSDNPVINVRSFGEDKKKVAEFGAAYMKGMQDENVATSAKHFPGHGDTNVDSHKGLPVLPFDISRLENMELYPFRYLIDKNVDMVMIGHLQIPMLDSTGTPASVSKTIITDYLKGKMGYKGIVITDALEMDGLAKNVCDGKKNLIPLEAFKAGADILLMPQEVENSMNEIINAIKRKEISMDFLNEKVRKVIELKAKLGLFAKSNRHFQIDTVGLLQKVNNKRNEELISKLCENSITVVRNEKINSLISPDAFTLRAIPVKQHKNKKIAYIGYFGEQKTYDFANILLTGSDSNKSLLNRDHVEGIKVDTFFINKGIGVAELTNLKEELKYYDLIILGIHETDSRPQRGFGINEEQMDFFTEWAAKQNIVAVYFGSPYALNKIKNYKNFKSIVIAYSNSVFNNIAAAKVVLGISPALGSLPVSAGGLNAGYSAE